MTSIEWDLDATLKASYEKGYEEGLHEAQVTLIIKMLQHDMSVSEVANIMQWPTTASAKSPPPTKSL